MGYTFYFLSLMRFNFTKGDFTNMNGNQQNPEADLMGQFQAMQNRSEMSEVLKELFDLKKLMLIGDISLDEAKLITRIMAVVELKKIPAMEKALIMYMKLRISVDRKSRKEILDAIRSYQPQPSFMGGMRNMFGRNRGGM